MVDKDLHPKGAWLVQVEVPQDPLSNDQKEHILWTIQQLRLKVFDHPNLPKWYKEMSKYEKKLFFETFKDCE